AFGDDDTPTVTNQPCVGDGSPLADRRQIVDLHLDRREAVIRLRGADDGKSDCRVDEACDRAAVHHTLQLQELLPDLHAQTGAPRLDLVELDSKQLREMIGLELFADRSFSVRSYFHSGSFFALVLSLCGQQVYSCGWLACGFGSMENSLNRI